MPFCCQHRNSKDTAGLNLFYLSIPLPPLPPPPSSVPPSALPRSSTVRSLLLGESKEGRGHVGETNGRRRRTQRGAPRRRTDGTRVESTIERPVLAAQTAVTGLHRGSFSWKEAGLRRGAALTSLVENKERSKKVKQDLKYYFWKHFICVNFFGKYLNRVKNESKNILSSLVVSSS